MKVAAQDDDESPRTSQPGQQWPPASPPPSFHSRASSPNGTSRLLSEDPIRNDEDRTLADTFDSDSEDEEDSDGRDDRQRLMRGTPQTEDAPVAPGIQRRVTELPVFNTQTPSSGRVYGGGNGGVWANLSAKPTRGEDAEEKPPVRTSQSGRPYQALANRCHSPTNKPPQMPHPLTGRPLSSPPAPLATKSLSKACPSAPSSPSSGTP